MFLLLCILQPKHYLIGKSGRKCIKHFIKHHQTPMFDEMFDAFEMNHHNFEKFRKEEKNRV